MHWPAQDGARVEDYWRALLDMKAQGKVCAIGLSNLNVAQLETAERIGHVDTLQPPFSAIRREFAAAELPWCREHETGVIVYSPMQAGLLTGAFTEARAKKLAPDDWRSRAEEFTGEKLKRNLTRRHEDGGRAPRHDGRRRRGGLDAGLAWGHRRYRRRTRAGADRRLDRGRHAHPHPRRPRGDRGHHQGHGRGHRAGTSAERVSQTVLCTISARLR
jgi:hypothetical protein